MFSGDRDVVTEEQFAPGSELVYRCADIGEYLALGRFEII